MSDETTQQPTQATTQAAPETTTTTPDAVTAETWETWVASLDEAERGRMTRLYEDKNTGLIKALDSERERAKSLEKSMRELAGKAEKGSDNEKLLTEMADKLDLANRKADFFRDASKPDLGLADPEAAWILADAKPDAFRDRKGNIDFDALKQAHPWLFRQPRPTPTANAGAGTGGDPTTAQDFNDAIRTAAGY
jgi:hypothetical protein